MNIKKVNLFNEEKECSFITQMIKDEINNGNTYWFKLDEPDTSKDGYIISGIISFIIVVIIYIFESNLSNETSFSLLFATLKWVSFTLILLQLFEIDIRYKRFINKTKKQLLHELDIMSLTDFANKYLEKYDDLDQDDKTEPFYQLVSAYQIQQKIKDIQANYTINEIIANEDKKTVELFYILNDGMVAYIDFEYHNLERNINATDNSLNVKTDGITIIKSYKINNTEICIKED